MDLVQLRGFARDFWPFTFAYASRVTEVCPPCSLECAPLQCPPVTCGSCTCPGAACELPILTVIGVGAVSFVGGVAITIWVFTRLSAPELPINAADREHAQERLRLRLLWRPGDRVLVRYEGEPLWHERLVIGEAFDGNWMIGTPDFDVYEEPLQPCGEVADVIAMPSDRVLPARIPEEDAYLIYNRRTVTKDISASQEQKLRADGLAYLGALRAARERMDASGASQGPRFRRTGKGPAAPSGSGPASRRESAVISASPADPGADGAAAGRSEGAAQLRVGDDDGDVWLVADPSRGFAVGAEVARPANARRRFGISVIGSVEVLVQRVSRTPASTPGTGCRACSPPPEISLEMLASSGRTKPTPGQHRAGAMPPRHGRSWRVPSGRCARGETWSAGFASSSFASAAKAWATSSPGPSPIRVP